MSKEKLNNAEIPEYAKRINSVFDELSKNESLQEEDGAICIVNTKDGTMVTMLGSSFSLALLLYLAAEKNHVFLESLLVAANYFTSHKNNINGN